MGTRMLLAALAGLATASACVHTASSRSTLIETRSGPVRGAYEAGVLSFKGIPYAQPPTGEMRWRPPSPAIPWNEPLDATAFGAQCVQPQRPNVRQPVNLQMSEDCLTLNVWTPRTSMPERLPVLVWIHGGNFTLSSGAGYDGANLARRGIVVVSLNYRLGAIGFLAHPALSLESEHKVSGNYGLMDQIAALQWVRANIAAFGGDENKVTIAGQSAGATSVADLVVSPMARNLFSQAILQSAGGSFGSQVSLAEAEAEGLKLGADVATLRAMSANELIAKFPQKSAVSPEPHFYPNIDGFVVPDAPLALLSAARARVPMLIGYNSDEALFWSRDLPTTLEGYRDYVAAWFPPDEVSRILERYPAASDAEVARAVAQFVTDFKIATPTAQIAKGMAAVAPVYAYRFSRASPATRASFGGVAHTVEVAYVFDVLSLDDAQYEARDRALAKEMADAWVQFVKTGSASHGTLLWPLHSAPDFQVVEFGDTTAIDKISSNSAIAFFESMAEDR